VALGDEVVVLAPHAPDVAPSWDDGGVEVRSFRYAPAGLEVIGYSRTLDRDETMKPAAALATPLYALGARRALRGLLRRRRFDLLHAHWVVPNGLVARPYGRRLALAIGLHGSDVFLAERRGVRRLVGASLSRAILLTGCSPELVRRVSRLGFDGLEAVIPYGVDIDQFSPDRERRQLWRQQLGVPESAVVALSVGRMVTKKGYQVLLPLLPQLFDLHPELHLIFAGGGDRLEEFRQQCAGLEGRVHFPGVVLRDTLPDLYRAADLFVLPAVHDPRGNVDGLPNVILEAMASGLPVVASGISGIPLAIDDGVEGLLVPEQSPEPLAAAVSALAADGERRRRKGEAACRRARTELTWKAVAGRYRDAYVAALEANESSRNGAEV
jgi:glycosyltransferase involved in cell wall biosynthesis